MKKTEVASAFYLRGKNNFNLQDVFQWFVASAFYLRGKNNGAVYGRLLPAVASAFYLRGKNNNIPYHLQLNLDRNKFMSIT